MNAAIDAKSTSEIQMIAAGTVANQAQICGARRESTDRLISDLAEKVDALTKIVGDLKTTVAVLKTRWQLFAIAGGLVGVTGTLVGILVAIFK